MHGQQLIDPMLSRAEGCKALTAALHLFHQSGLCMARTTHGFNRIFFLQGKVMPATNRSQSVICVRV